MHLTHQPVILIDQPEDEYVEHSAWVEVTSEVTPEVAVTLIEGKYPIEDRGEEERYVCNGTTWQKPADAEPNDEYVRWQDAQPEDEGAKCFHVVKVVCAA